MAKPMEQIPILDLIYTKNMGQYLNSWLGITTGHNIINGIYVLSLVICCASIVFLLIVDGESKHTRRSDDDSWTIYGRLAAVCIMFGITGIPGIIFGAFLGYHIIAMILGWVWLLLDGVFCLGFLWKRGVTAYSKMKLLSRNS